METMTACEPEAWKRGSLASAEEMVCRGMRKARSLENLETLTESFRNLEMRKKSSESPGRMLTDRDVKAWSKYLRMISVQTKEALAPSVGEEEALAQEGLAEKTSSHWRGRALAPSVMREKNDSTVEEENQAMVPSVDNDDDFPKEELDNMKIDFRERGTILGVLIVDLLGMGGESKQEAARRRLDAVLADEAAMDRLRAELRHQDESQRKPVEQEEEDVEMKRSDKEAWMAREYRRRWISIYSPKYGSFDDTTRLGPMRFTDEPAPVYSASPMDTLQVFSVKVAGIKRSLKWPVDVFGVVAVRDCIDNNRNIIFSRTRDRCQTLTAEDRYLVLSGPTRAVVWSDHVIIEVKLTVKGTTESEDKDLSFLAVPLLTGDTGYSNLFCCYKTSKLSTLEFTLGHIVSSVEATIFVRVIDGLWLDSFRGQFSAYTTGRRDRNFRSTDHKKIILLDSVGEKFHVSGDGEIAFSRRVVSVECRGNLKVCVKSWSASECGKKVMKDELIFKPKEDKRSHGVLDVGFCKMEVTVAWSLISYHPVPLSLLK